MLVPKPSKDLQECASYRPISLMKVDFKTLALFSSKRGLDSHGSKMGFMPGKGTNINIQLIFLNNPRTP